MSSGTRLFPIVALCFLASSAQAATPPESIRAPAIQAIVACREIVDSTGRLACFDATVANMQAAEAQGDLLTIDKAQRRAVRRQAFGLSLPSFTLFDRGERPEEANILSLKVQRAWRNADGRWMLLLEDDQLWRQIDSADLSRDPRAGVTAEIHKAALGSFMMSLDRQPPIRVHRDR